MKKFLVYLIMIIICISGISLFSENNVEIEILRNIQSKKYKQAIKLISESINNISKKDYYTYLKGISYYNINDYPNGKKVFSDVIKKYPNSRWAVKSKYKLALIYYKEKKYKKSYLIYKAQLKYLLSKNRRKKYSEIYSKLAKNLAFNKKKKKRKYQDAVVYFQRALNLGSETKKDEYYLKFSLAKTYFLWKKYYKAIELFKKFIKENKKSKLIGNANYYLGESYYKVRRLWQARKYFKQVIAKYTKNKFLVKSAYMTAKTYRIKYTRNIMHLEMAVKFLKLGYKKYQDKKYSPLCAYEAGKAYARFPQFYDKAIKSFLEYVSRFKKHKKAGEGLYLAANLYLRLKNYKSAQNLFKRLLNNYPNHKYWQRAQRYIVTTTFLMAKDEYDKKNYNKAKLLLTDFINNYALDRKVARAMYLIGMIHFKKKEYKKAVKKFEDLFSRYSYYKFGSLGIMKAADIYITKLDNFKEGIKAYKKVKNRRYKKIAQKIIANLEKQYLNVKVKRLFLSSEKPQIELKLRNIKKYKINIYKVDLKDYFYKKNSINGVENLDILLIRPDITIDKKIKKFIKYKTYEEKISLNINKPGGYVVQIVSEKLNSTALILKSDIAVFTRSDKRKTLVYVKNLKNKTGQRNTEILLSNGVKVFHKAKTNNKGIAIVDLEKIAKEEGIRPEKIVVFAKHGTNYTTSDVNLKSVRVIEGRKNIGYIYGDKPLYQPGDIINFKAVLRIVNLGEIKIPKQKKYKVTFTTPGGNLFYTQVLNLNEFGTLNGKIKLDSAISAGDAKILIKSLDNKLVFSQKIKIRKYITPKTQIQVETDKEVYVPGDIIKFKVKVNMLFGMPYKNKVIRYQVFRENPKRVKTNSAGIARFKIDSQKYGRRNRIQIKIILSDGQIKRKVILFRLYDFKMEVKTSRQLFIAEENIPIIIETTNLKDKPINKKVKAVLYSNFRGASVEITEKTVITKNGKAIVRFKVKKGGKYFVRITGFGKNNIPYTRSTKFQVAGKKSKEKIFILNDELQKNAGTTFNLKVFSRLENDTALIVINGEKIFYKKEVKINKGNTIIPLKILSKYSPEVKISVHLLSIKGTFNASKNINVKKSLKIKISGLKKKYKPGQKISFSVSARDLSGRAGNTEVSVAVVDDAVFQAYSDKIRSINKAFKLNIKTNAFTYSGSMPFSYNGVTKTRNREVIRERDIRRLDAIATTEGQPRDRIFDSSTASPSEDRRRRLGAGQTGSRYFRNNRPNALRGFRSSRNGASADEPQRSAGPSGIVSNIPRQLQERLAFQRATQENQRNYREILRKLFKETAYFIPSLKIKGSKKVSFKLPDNTTKWRIIVIGVTRNNKFGMKQKYFTTTKPSIVQINTPFAIYQGDKIKFNANIFNSTNKRIASRFRFNINAPERTYNFSGNYNVLPANETEIEANSTISLNRTGRVKVNARIAGDSTTANIPVLQWAQKQRKGISGFTNKTIVRNIEIPAGFTNRELFFKIFPRNIKVLEKLRFQRNYFFYIFTAQAAASILTELSYFKAIKNTENESSGRISELKKTINRKILVLQAFMLYNGSYNWIKHRPVRDDFTTIFNFYVLSRAKEMGFKVNNVKLKKSRRYLTTQFHKSVSLDKKVLILWALAHHGKVDYSYINRLYRLRGQLSSRGLALLAMLLLKDNRKTQADNVITYLNRKKQKDVWKLSGRNKMDFLSSREEVTMLAVMAMLRANKYPLQIKRSIRRMLVEIERTNRPNDFFQALFSEAFADYLLKYSGGASSITLTLKVNGKQLFKKKLNPVEASIRKKFKGSFLREKNKIEILISGQGDISYSAIIYYLKPGFVRENVKEYGYIKKYYLYPRYRLNGKVLSRGYTIAHGDFNLDKKIQTIKKIGLKRIIPVRLRVKLKKFDEKYFILRDYIPAGCRLVPRSVSGNLVYYQQRGNELLIYIKKSNNSWVNVYYELLTVFEGKFRTLPPRMYPFRKPNKEIIGKIKHLEIQNEQYDTFKYYKFTPNERYEIAKYYFKEKKYKKCVSEFQKLLNNFSLKNSYYKEAGRMLLLSSIKLKNHRNVVKYFDILRERYPELELNLDDVKTIADSYAAIGEYERAYLLVKDLMEAYFSQENQLGVVLVQKNRLKDSIKVMKDLFTSYPDLETVKTVYYSYGQNLYYTFSNLNVLDKKRKKGKVLYSEARNIFVDFLSEYPEYENADEVSFTFLNLLLDKKRFVDLYNASVLFEKRYPKSKYVSDYKYLSAYALYELGKFSDAIKYAKEVAYNKFPSKDGIKRYSQNRYLAIHMLAKIYHALGKMNLAIKEYLKVASKFADARHSIQFLRRRNIHIAEVKRFKHGDNVVLNIKTKGIKKFEVKVYKVDFVILCLSKNDLSNIRNVNLTGISPNFTKVIKVNNASDNIVKTKINTSLTKKGAYLVVLKSGGIEASGIVLISDLNIDVQPNSSGRVRIVMKDNNGKPVNNGKIFIRGSYQRQTSRLRTDIRGVAESEGINGIPFVFGGYNGNYVFYRGNYEIGNIQRRPVRRIQGSRPIKPRKRRAEALRNILRKRRFIQRQQSQQFQENANRRIDNYQIRHLTH